MQSLKEAALHYAELGYRVFPCVPDGKEPATTHGCLDATTDVEQIERWWQSSPAANVAISTDGFLVVDVDPGGKPWLSLVNIDDLLRGAITRTPRDGLHYWFRQNGTELHNTAGKLSLGVDTRGTGGYVLVPPSVVDGHAYEWLSDLDDRLPAVPGWLVEQLGSHQRLRDSATETIAEGQRNQVLIRYAGYYRRGGLSEEEILSALRGNNEARCRPLLEDKELTEIAKSAARYEPDFIAEAVLNSHFEDAERLEAEEPAAEFPSACLTAMPDVMREAYDFILDSAIKPQPELTLGALVALFGAAFGRKVADDYDTRTNIMVMALAPSGAGKEHPRQCVKRLLFESGLQQVNGPERIGSHAGIITSVDAHPIRLFQLDEIGRLLATMRDPHASHLYNVGTVLMALYSSANTIWTGDAYADLAKVKTLYYPHVCVYGTSVPESLYSGLSSENLTDGLVGRLVVFQSLDIPERRKPNKVGTPWRVTELLKMWSEFQPAGWGNLPNRGGPPQLAEKTDEANQRHEWYCNKVNSKHKTEDSISSSVWSRAPEKAAKLALIYACCAAGNTEPTITLEAENWGIELANYSTRLVLQAARNSVSGSKYEADLKYVFAAIPPVGQGEIAQNELTRKTQRLKLRERADILINLQVVGAVEMVTETTGKRPKTVYRRRKNTL